MDPRLIEQAKNALASCGTVTAAARSLGIPRSTLRTRLAGVPSEIISPASTSAGDDAIRKEYEAKRQELEAIIAKQAEALEKARLPRVPIPVTPAQRGKAEIRAVFPDVHGNLHDPKALAAFLGDMEMVKPHTMIGLGDFLECGGFLAQKHTLGYVAEIEQVSWEEDVAIGNAILDKLQGVCGKIEMLEGNHESRVEKWVVNQTLRERGAARFLYDLVSPEKVLGMKKRGIPYHKYHLQHDGLEAAGVIRRGRCYYSHGFSTSRHAAWSHILQMGGNVVYGHTHRADYSVNRTVAHGMAAAWCPGTLSKLTPMWRHNSPTNWTHGYILQVIAPGGKFQTLQVPIVDGVSMLGTVLAAMGG